MDNDGTLTIAAVRGHALRARAADVLELDGRVAQLGEFGAVCARACALLADGTARVGTYNPQTRTGYVLRWDPGADAPVVEVAKADTCYARLVSTRTHYAVQMSATHASKEGVFLRCAYGRVGAAPTHAALRNAEIDDMAISGEHVYLLTSNTLLVYDCDSDAAPRAEVLEPGNYTAVCVGGAAASETTLFTGRAYVPFGVVLERPRLYRLAKDDFFVCCAATYGVRVRGGAVMHFGASGGERALGAQSVYADGDTLCMALRDGRVHTAPLHTLTDVFDTPDTPEELVRKLDDALRARIGLTEREWHVHDDARALALVRALEELVRADHGDDARTAVGRAARAVTGASTAVPRCTWASDIPAPGPFPARDAPTHAMHYVFYAFWVAMCNYGVKLTSRAPIEAATARVDAWALATTVVETACGDDVRGALDVDADVVHRMVTDALDPPEARLVVPFVSSFGPSVLTAYVWDADGACTKTEPLAGEAQRRAFVDRCAGPRLHEVIADHVERSPRAGADETADAVVDYAIEHQLSCYTSPHLRATVRAMLPSPAVRAAILRRAAARDLWRTCPYELRAAAERLGGDDVDADIDRLEAEAHNAAWAARDTAHDSDFMFVSLEDHRVVCGADSLAELMTKCDALPVAVRGVVCRRGD